MNREQFRSLVGLVAFAGLLVVLALALYLNAAEYRARARSRCQRSLSIAHTASDSLTVYRDFSYCAYEPSTP